jgi:hypothetical protein
MNSDGTGYLAQRSMGCRTDHDSAVAGVVFTWLQILLRSLIWLSIGVGLLVIYPFGTDAVGADGFAAAREITFVTGINDLLPPGIRGIMLTGLLAALASTIDTHLNWGASYWSNDIYQRLICKHWLKREPKSHELVLAARLSNLLILVVAITIMANLGSIQQAWFISLLFGAGMGSVLVMRWLWERISLYSELTAIIASLIVAPILLVATDQEWIRLGSMSLVSTAVAVAAALIGPKTDTATLVAFYSRVKPAGWWRRTAVAAGDPATVPIHRFYLGAGSILWTAASLYLLLVGIGKLVARLPGDPLVWPVLYIVLGTTLLPVWWRRLQGRRGRRVEQATA